MPFNTAQPFTSKQLLRETTALAKYSQNYQHLTQGTYIHWSLPDALTTMRADPTSNNQMRFPQVPNRWLITRKSKPAATWQVEAQWVVESDYLYPEAATGAGLTPREAITFPIVSPEIYKQILTTPPPDRPTDFKNVPAPYKAIYAAPFRYMGRVQTLSDWQANTPSEADYLPYYVADGLTAVGYGDPFFAAIYSNCYNVFGFCDRDTDNSRTYRYDIMGWYDPTDLDCLHLYAALAKQQPNTNLYTALQTEYKWKVIQPPAAFPALSVYYYQSGGDSLFKSQSRSG